MCKFCTKSSIILEVHPVIQFPFMTIFVSKIVSMQIVTQKTYPFTIKLYPFTAAKPQTQTFKNAPSSSSANPLQPNNPPNSPKSSHLSTPSSKTPTIPSSQTSSHHHLSNTTPSPNKTALSFKSPRLSKSTSTTSHSHFHHLTHFYQFHHSDKIPNFTLKSSPSTCFIASSSLFSNPTINLFSP